MHNLVLLPSQSLQHLASLFVPVFREAVFFFLKIGFWDYLGYLFTGKTGACLES